MTETKTQKAQMLESDFEIDLKRIYKAFFRRIWLAMLVALLCGALGFFCIAPKYTTTVTFYTESASLVDTYIVLLDTGETLREIAADGATSLTPAHLRGMITAERLEAANLFRVVVTDTEQGRLARLATAVANVLPRQMEGVADAPQAKVVDQEKREGLAYFDPRFYNGILGLLLGFALGAAAILIWELRRDPICSKADIQRLCVYPVLASVEDLENAAEDFVRLRTKLQHLLPGKRGRIVGICAVEKETYEDVAENLAYSLSRQGRRVLVVECDLRRFSEDACHGGLSGFLAGRNGAEGLIRHCGVKGHEKAYHVLSAGRNPPNPAELLGSKRMGKLLKKLRTIYDDVILDLPPIGKTADGLVLATHMDGLILTLCRNCCSRTELTEALAQMEALDAPILGIVDLPESD